MLSPMLLGPINGGLGLLATVAMVVGVVLALRRVHRGEPVPVAGVALALVLPLLLAAWAGTAQHDAAMEWAMTHPRVEYRQTLMAAMLSRTIATQLYAGLVVVVGGLGLLGGALALTVRGERPRWLVGAVATSLAVVLVSVAAVGMSAYPTTITAVRIGSYVAAAAVGVVALIAAHRRGPGVQLASLTAVVLPVLVVGADLVALGGFATLRITEVAAAPPSAKQGLMDAALAALDTLQASAALGLGLAALLALLGPVVAWRRERPMAIASGVALAGVVLVAAIGLTWSMGWSAPFR